MPTRFVCLANSFKEGGRCLAGVELDNNNHPTFINGRPKWIRPVSNTPHGEVPTGLVANIHILDLIEIIVTNIPQERDYQSENVLFDENSIRIVGRYNIINIQQLCENRYTIFGNRGKAVSKEVIAELTNSLMLVKTNQFEVIEKNYDDCTNRPQVRLLFHYRNSQYDLPITDPVFLHSYHSNPDLLNGLYEIYLSLSLGVCWKEWYYKLVAGIIIPNRQVVGDDIDIDTDDGLPF